MPFDLTSFAEKTQEYNPLKTIQDITQLKTQQESLKKAQMENQLQSGRMKLGSLYSKNTVDGNTDWQNMGSDVAGDPETARVYDEFLKQREGHTALQKVFDPETGKEQTVPLNKTMADFNAYKVEQQHIDDAHDNLDHLQKKTQSLIDKPDLSMSDILDQSADLANDYNNPDAKGKLGLSAQELTKQLGTIPVGPNGGEPTAEQLRGWLKGNQQQLQQTKQAVNQIHGSHTRDKAALTAQDAQDEADLQASVQGAQNPSPRMTVNPNATRDASLAPGMENVVKKAGEDLASDKTALTGSATTLFNMQEAMNSLKEAPTGNGSEYRDWLKSYATTFFPKQFEGTDWAKDTKAYSEAQKYLANQARANAAQFGPNTNENLAKAVTGTPNTNIDKLAAIDLQKVAMGLTRLNFARTALFNDQFPNGSPLEYQDYGPQFNQQVDPRGFMVDIMPKAELRKVLESLPKTLKDGSPNPEREKFDRAYDMATTYGLMKHVAAK